MRIQILVALFNSPATPSELTFWETLTVASVQQAEEHCRNVEKGNATVYLAFYSIIAE